MINTKALRPIEYIDLIRIGRPNDGGYVVPRKIFSLCDGLLSYGINKDWSFERAFWNKNPDAFIHCYDHSVTFLSLILFTIKSFFQSIIYLVLLDIKRFKKAFFGFFVIPNYFIFFRDKRSYFKKKISKYNKENNINIEKSIDKILKCGAKNIFLKMDIETSEYEVVQDIFNSKKNIVGLAIEFHKIDDYSVDFNLIIKKLKNFFFIVHVHANNYGKLTESGFPSILEITFLNKKFIKPPVKLSTRKYPVEGLDQANRISKKDYIIKFWNNIYNFFLNLATGAPIISLYFATVLLAIG